jgi:hypothetical protein
LALFGADLRDMSGRPGAAAFGFGDTHTACARRSDRGRTGFRLRHFSDFRLRDHQARPQTSETPRSMTMTHYRTILMIGAASLFCLTSAAFAASPSKAVQTHCVKDYKAFCSEWGIETKGLSNCMRKHGDQLNAQCVAALVQSGEVSQAEVNARKKK